MQVIILDNYDSFTYNLVHLVAELTNIEPLVYKNDQCSLDELARASHLILSPGPGIPDEAGILKKSVEVLGPSHKILGVCLGFQAIGEVYGGRLKNLEKVFHGMQSNVIVTDVSDPVLGNVTSPFFAGRYHSWVIERGSLPDCMSVSAVDEAGEIMAARHRTFSVYGVQFHPESIMTPSGKDMINNFLSL